MNLAPMPAGNVENRATDSWLEARLLSCLG